MVTIGGQLVTDDHREWSPWRPPTTLFINSCNASKLARRELNSPFGQNRGAGRLKAHVYGIAEIMVTNGRFDGALAAMDLKGSAIGMARSDRRVEDCDLRRVGHLKEIDLPQGQPPVPSSEQKPLVQVNSSANAMARSDVLDDRVQSDQELIEERIWKNMYSFEGKLLCQISVEI